MQDTRAGGYTYTHADLHTYTHRHTYHAGGYQPVPRGEQTQLSAADVFHANRLIEYGVCQHDTPPEGYTPDYRFRQLYGYQEQWIGEIGACGFANGTDAVQGWHNSEGHRGILVAPDALHVGVASVQDVFFAVLGKPWGFGFEVDTRQKLEPVRGDK
jgi:uncharacterized protein YkwD